MAEYLLTPRAVATTWEPVEVALAAATTKTVLQVNIVAATDITLLGWGVSFDGVSGTGIPVSCHLIEGDVAASAGTTMTPETWGNALSPASLCIGGAALSGYNFGTEGTMTAVRMLDVQHVHPQAGYGIWWPQANQPKCGSPGTAKFLRIRCKAAAIVNVIPWVCWSEPAI